MINLPMKVDCFIPSHTGTAVGKRLLSTVHCKNYTAKILQFWTALLQKGSWISLENCPGTKREPGPWINVATNTITSHFLLSRNLEHLQTLKAGSGNSKNNDNKCKKWNRVPRLHAGGNENQVFNFHWSCS